MYESQISPPPKVLDEVHELVIRLPLASKEPIIMSFIASAVVAARLHLGLEVPCLEEVRHEFTAPIPTVDVTVDRMPTATYLSLPLLARERTHPQSINLPVPERILD